MEKLVKGVHAFQEEVFRSERALFKRLATLRTDVPITETFEDLAWKGALPELRDLTRELGFPDVCERVHAWSS